MRPTPIRAADPQLAERPALTTIANVELLSTGTYHLASGLTTFTEDDLADAVAAQDDPGVLPPRIKIGHTDPRFNGDGDPALGKVTGMRLSENGQTIIGDFVGVPTWLADVMPSAYPSRSIEGDFNVEVGAEGVIGGETERRKYRLIISSVALLGTMMPGVEVLEDLPGLFDGTTFADVARPQGGVQGGATFEAMRVNAASKGRQVQASINIEDVRRAYYDAIDGDPDAWSYWIRAIYIDPNQLIVDTGDGDSSLLMIPFDVSSAGEVQFGETAQVKVEYVAAAGQAAAATGRRVTVYASRDDARPDNEEVAMTPEELRQLRTAFGMADDASEEDVRAELAKRGTPAAETEPETEPPAGEPDPEPEPGTPEPEPTPEPTPEPESTPEPQATEPEPVAAGGEGVTVDSATFDQLKRDAKAGRAARTEQLNEARERLLSDAVKAGKIPPARKDHYRELHKRDPKGTEDFLGKMESGVLPVNEEEVGEAGAVDASASAYPQDWFPEVKRSDSGDRPFVTKD